MFQWTGKEVAVKVFSASSYQRPFQVQLREYDVMRKLNNENIVTQLAVEEEVVLTFNFKDEPHHFQLVPIF